MTDVLPSTEMRLRLDAATTALVKAMEPDTSMQSILTVTRPGDMLIALHLSAEQLRALYTSATIALTKINAREAARSVGAGAR